MRDGGEPDGGYLFGAMLHRLEEGVSSMRERLRTLEASFVSKDELHRAEEKLGERIEARIQERAVHNRAVIMSDVDEKIVRTDERLREIVREEGPHIVDERLLALEERKREAKAKATARLKAKIQTGTAIVSLLTAAIALAYATWGKDRPSAVSDAQKLSRQVERASN